MMIYKMSKKIDKKEMTGHNLTKITGVMIKIIICIFIYMLVTGF